MADKTITFSYSSEAATRRGPTFLNSGAGIGVIRVCFGHYPRTLQTDLPLLERLGVDEVIAPNVTELYPKGYGFRMKLNNGAPVMEHAHRPGFLQGVLTVVLKLLNIVRANRAYFGEKDYQQLKVITEMVEEFFIPTMIVSCPTVRDESGLAESSRNQPAAGRGEAESGMFVPDLDECN